MSENFRPLGTSNQLAVTVALVVGTIGALFLSGNCSADEDQPHINFCDLATHSTGYAEKDIVIDGVVELGRTYSLTDTRCPDSHLRLDVSFAVYTRESRVRALLDALHRDDGIPHDREGIKAILKGRYRVDPNRFPSRVFILESVLKMEEMERIPD